MSEFRSCTEKRKLYEYRCEICGAEIHSVGKKRVIKCETCLKREYSRKYRSDTNSPYRKYTNNSALQRDVVEIMEYNREHGTNYSYGQYKFIKKLGEI